MSKVNSTKYCYSCKYRKNCMREELIHGKIFTFYCKNFISNYKKSSKK